MSEFKWRQFEGEILLWAVHWYCRYGIRYRDLEQRIGRARRAGRSFHESIAGFKGTRLK
jgi:transposase-like protein